MSSEAQPSSKALVAVDDASSKALVLQSEFKVPKVKKKKVLEEEDYEANITKIIERDYYPDLPKLKAQGEFLEAKARNDTEKLRELHIKYGPKRQNTARTGSSSDRPTTDILTTPASFETPTDSKKLKTPGPNPDVKANQSGSDSSQQSAAQDGKS